MPKPKYKLSELKNNPQEREKLKQTVSMIALQYGEARDLFNRNNRLGVHYEDWGVLKNTDAIQKCLDGEIDDEKTFDLAVRGLREAMARYRLERPADYKRFQDNVPGFDEMTESLRLHGKNTLGDASDVYSAKIHFDAADVTDESLEKVESDEIGGYMGLFSAIYEKTKGAEDWEATPETKEDQAYFKEIHDNGAAIGARCFQTVEEKRAAFAMLDDLERGNGEKISREMTRLILERYVPRLASDTQEVVRDNRKLRANVKNPDEANAMMFEKLADIMLPQVLTADDLPQGAAFVEASEKLFKMREAMQAAMKGFAREDNEAELVRMVCQRDGSKRLADAFRKHIATFDRIPDGLPNKLRPTAKERIEALQAKIKSKKTEPAKKRMYAAEIVATREAVNAQRGGAGLDAVITSEMFGGIVSHTDEVVENFVYIFGEDAKSFDKYLLADATSGHGGKMTENYYSYYGNKVNAKNVMKDEKDLPEDLDDRLMPTAKKRIEGLQYSIKEAARAGVPDRDMILERMAGILAVRENVKAKRGGEGLENRLSNAKKLANVTREYKDMLSLLDEADLQELEQKAVSGHGGAMKEIFDSPRIQQKLVPKQIEKFGEDATAMVWSRQEGERAQGFARMLYFDAIKSAKGWERQRSMLRNEQVDMAVEKFKELPHFKHFMDNMKPETLAAAERGDLATVVGAWRDAALEYQNLAGQKGDDQQKNAGEQYKAPEVERQDQGIQPEPQPRW